MIRSPALSSSLRRSGAASAILFPLRRSPLPSESLSSSPPPATLTTVASSSPSLTTSMAEGSPRCTARSTLLARESAAVPPPAPVPKRKGDGRRGGGGARGAAAPCRGISRAGSTSRSTVAMARSLPRVRPERCRSASLTRRRQSREARGVPWTVTAGREGEEGDQRVMWVTRGGAAAWCRRSTRRRRREREASEGRRGSSETCTDSLTLARSLTIHPQAQRIPPPAANQLLASSPATSMVCTSSPTTVETTSGSPPSNSR
mmetsp:Transcript_24227/g.55128  ORF Transcript_24227/g.55128 Transcript_24227/m.55128 type:complete len:261 (+) Transcript_24227:3953-4735(+)